MLSLRREPSHDGSDRLSTRYAVLTRPGRGLPRSREYPPLVADGCRRSAALSTRPLRTSSESLEVPQARACFGARQRGAPPWSAPRRLTLECPARTGALLLEANARTPRISVGASFPPSDACSLGGRRTDDRPSVDAVRRSHAAYGGDWWIAGALACRCGSRLVACCARETRRLTSPLRQEGERRTAIHVSDCCSAGSPSACWSRQASQMSCSSLVASSCACWSCSCPAEARLSRGARRAATESRHGILAAARRVLDDRRVCALVAPSAASLFAVEAERAEGVAGEDQFGGNQGSVPVAASDRRVRTQRIPEPLDAVGHLICCSEADKSSRL